MICPAVQLNPLLFNPEDAFSSGLVSDQICRSIALCSIMLLVVASDLLAGLEEGDDADGARPGSPVEVPPASSVDGRELDHETEAGPF